MLQLLFLKSVTKRRQKQHSETRSRCLFQLTRLIDKFVHCEPSDMRKHTRYTQTCKSADAMGIEPATTMHNYERGKAFTQSCYDFYEYYWSNLFREHNFHLVLLIESFGAWSISV